MKKKERIEKELQQGMELGDYAKKGVNGFG